MRKKAVLFLCLFVFLLSAVILNAQDTDEEKKVKSDLEQKIAEYEKKLGELREQKSTLSSQIQYMDTQIFLTGLKIQETEKKVTETAKEIETLGSRIKGLDSSINHLSKLVLSSVVNDYKQRSVSLIDMLLDSDSANNLVDRIKYYDTAQSTRQKIFMQAMEAKLNFEQQKDLREKKKEDLDKLQRQLDVQEVELQAQQEAKKTLLADTQNDETTYQRLLAQAKAQVAAFSSFVQSSGASSVIGANGLGTGSDGNYFSQRDERWAMQRMGNSDNNVLSVGCLATSISMVLKKNGVSIDPGVITSNASNFYLNTAYMKLPRPGWPGGFSTDSSIKPSDVDNELSQGRYVIAGINYGSGCSGTSDHFVVLTKKDGNDYIMHDPIYGPDLKFSSHYSQVCWAEVIR